MFAVDAAAINSNGIKKLLGIGLTIFLLTVKQLLLTVQEVFSKKFS